VVDLEEVEIIKMEFQELVALVEAEVVVEFLQEEQTVVTVVPVSSLSHILHKA
jgi:hypothetical protein